MIITEAEFRPHTLPPEFYDRDVAARTSSLFCWVFAFWFFVTPWTFFGVSGQSSAWNAWIIGGAMMLASIIRMSHPEGTTAFSMLNFALSVWVLISPFVFGYVADTMRLVNTLAVGAMTLGLSLMSLLITKDVDRRIGTPDV